MNHTRNIVWQLKDVKETFIEDKSANGGINVPCGSGRRLIINQLGSGFLQNCGECFVGVTDSADYHKEMNSMHFENWWKSMVLPNMPTKAVVVIDNATYHSRLTEDSRKPTMAWKKALIQEWLREKNA